MGDWWTATGTQEGCHFDHDAQADVINRLRLELDAQALDHVGIAASDENKYDQATSTWNSFTGFTQNNVAKVNVHGYQYHDGRRDILYSAVEGKRLWNSEYTDQQGNGLGLASCLNLDFQDLHPTAWVYWQPLDSGGFGLIASNPGDHWIGLPNVKYYVFAHYTRHIREGMTLVSSGERDSVVAWDKATGKLVIVSVNYNVPRYKSFHIGQTASQDVVRWCTNVDGGDMYSEHHDTNMQDGRFWSWFGANTVQTFEVQLQDASNIMYT